MDASAPVILLLAAGQAQRFGSAKQLADFHGQPMLRHLARMALQTGAPVITVLGAEAESAAGALAGLPLAMVRHAGWPQGMGSSLAAGMHALSDQHPHASCVVIMLADQPLVDTAALNRMLSLHLAHPSAILAAQHGDVGGPPALFPRDYFARLAACQGHQGARGLLASLSEHVIRLEGVNTQDVDTVEDLQQARQAWTMQRTEDSPAAARSGSLPKPGQ